jgi:ABC-type multidrug transport system fused ATPase/permease subunit
MQKFIQTWVLSCYYISMIAQKIKRKSKTLSQVLKFVYGRYTKWAVLRDLFFIVVTASEIYSISMVGKFIDETADILLNWEAFDIKTYLATDSFYYLVIVLLLWMLVRIGNAAREYFYYVIYEKVWQDAQTLVMSKVSHSNLQDVEKKDYQQLLTFIPSYSIDHLVLAYNDFSMLLSNIISLVSALAILFGTMSWSALLLGVFVLPEVIAVHLRRKSLRQYRDDQTDRFRYMDYLNATALSVESFPELRVDGVFSFLKRKYSHEYKQFMKGFVRQQQMFYENQALFSLTDQVFKYIYVIYVLSIAVVKKMSIGTFKALYDYVDVAYNNAYSFLNSASMISTRLDYIDDFFILLEYEGFGDRDSGDIHLPKDKTPTIELQKLDFAYPDDPKTKVLNNVSMKIEPGEKVAFFGSDASGKSSMVKVLTGLYEIVAGDYVIDGYSIRELDRGELKRKIAVTFQNFINYSLSLRENIIIGSGKRNINKSLYEEVKKVSLVKDFMKKEKLDDNQLLGRNFAGGKDFSPGYWQRLAIARMLYRNKQVFIMDEALTFVDAPSREKILTNMFEFLGDEKTLIFLTREMDNLKMFDRIYYFEKGRIVESGTWDELMKKKGKFYKQYKFSL